MGSHRFTCHPTQVNAPRLTPAMQAGTQFTYLAGMEGWVDLGDLIVPRPGLELATFRSQSDTQPLRQQDNQWRQCVVPLVIIHVKIVYCSFPLAQCTEETESSIILVFTSTVWTNLKKKTYGGSIRWSSMSVFCFSSISSAVLCWTMFSRLSAYFSSFCSMLSIMSNFLQCANC